MSRLDRILVSHNFNEAWPNTSLIALQRNLSDHCPLLVKQNFNDFGPKPFRFFNAWIKNDSFQKVVDKAWKEMDGKGRPGWVLKEKLKSVKIALKTWSKLNYGNLKNDLEKAKAEVDKFDDLAESKELDRAETERRIQAINSFYEKDNIYEDMLRQKAKANWMKEGDDDTKFFHCCLL